MPPGAWGFDDDAAMLPPVPMGRMRVVTTDVVVEGVDFDRALYPLVYAGARALAQNISDVAAMGAAPVGFVWSLAVPRGSLGADLDEFVRGAAAFAKTRRVPLFGGDLSSTSGPLVCSITAFGDVDGFPVRRSGARPCVTTCGSPPRRRLGRGPASPPEGGRARRQRQRRRRGLRRVDARAPRSRGQGGARPRAPFAPDGAPLAGRATSCIDISDGLAKDAHRLAAASAAALRLDSLQLAIDPAATPEDALGGGKDYALLFTLPAGASPPIESVRIGRVVEGEGVWHAGDRVVAAGFDHFS